MHRVARLFPFRRRVPLGDQIDQRYAQTANEQVIIPLHFSHVEELLAPYERLAAPHDPSEDLPCNLNIAFVEYLYRRLAEIPLERSLQLRLMAPSSLLAETAAEDHGELEGQLRDLIQQHFTYLAAVKRANLSRLARDSALLALLGLAALSLSIPVDALDFPEEASMSISLLGQGVTVFGWLTLWEALVNSLWTWRPVYRQWRMCQRLQGTAIALQLQPPSPKP